MKVQVNNNSNGWYVVKDKAMYLWKTDLKFHKWQYGREHGKHVYFTTRKKAELCLEKFRNKENKMYRMENGKDVSKETVEIALQAHFKANPEKSKFEPISIHYGCFKVGVDNDCITIKPVHLPEADGICRQNIKQVDEFIAALQSAKAFAIANK